MPVAEDDGQVPGIIKGTGTKDTFIVVDDWMHFFANLLKYASCFPMKANTKSNWKLVKSIMEPVRLSALGRDVHVGDLYNYFNDNILTNCAIKTLKQTVEINPICEVKHDFFFHQLPHKYKRYVLQINSHLNQNIGRGTMGSKRLWFAGYLERRSTQDEEDNLAQVDAIFHIARRTEVLDQRFVQQKMFDYQLNTGGKATHLVEKVVYGAELIISMERALDLNFESKASAEGNIYLAAKSFFQQIIDSKVCNRQRPAELDKINCTIFSSIDPGNVKNGTFEDSCKTLRDAVSSSTNEDKWKPIEMTLKDIPAQIEARIWSEKMSDVDFEKERQLAMLKAIIKESNVISKHPSINRVPPFEKVMCQFLDLLAPFRKEMESFHLLFFVKARAPGEFLSDMKPISDLLIGMTDWLMCRRKEIEIMCSLLSDTQLSMNDLEEIMNSVSSGKEKRTRVFILKMDYSPDPWIDSLAKFFGNQEPFKLPVFWIATSGKHRIDHLNRSLKAFYDLKTKSLLDCSYQIGLVPISSLLKDGTVITIECPIKPLLEIAATERSIEPSGNSQESQPPISDPEHSMLFPHLKTSGVPIVFNMQNLCITQKRKRDESLPDAAPIENDEKSYGVLYEKPCGASTPGIKTDSSAQERLSHQSACCDKETVCGATGRVAEIFAQETNQYAKLIKRGQPNVYLLNANEKLVNKDFRWFNMDKPGAPFTPEDNRGHKVIILMGATGCGKSSLINGMVNYILGVEWNDPFRFKCVRDDETIANNQAHSQTSLVTAYTLRHHEGMAIPYSITIIDTPGYGDTSGVQKNKEITHNIHQFLTQQETRVDEIHAAGFVAASGDSRLTTTQCYIIDSVLSIFGKDVMPNMRLLVTFADKDDPPVVEACLTAQFPVTSESAGITYSKFNSSVLYASNEKHGEDDICYDELFWGMGQENFYKFFAMLEGMNGRNVKSTLEVIQRRQQLEQPLEDIELELEDSLSTIEKIRQKLRECSNNMEANKNFVLEKTEVRYVEVEWGSYAYNCMRCKKTCEKPEKILNFEKKLCTNKDCNCPPHVHAYKHFALVPTSPKIKTTQLEMKTEYEANFKQKLTSEDELNMAKGKVLTLLEQLGTNARLLDSTDLRSNTPSPAEYLSLMKSRVFEEQAPGYLTRLQTLTELQQVLNAPAVLSTSTKTDNFTPVQPKNNQPEIKTRSCGRGRGILERDFISTVNPGTSQSTGIGETSSRSTQNLSGQSKIPLTGTVGNGNGTGARSQIQMTGINGNNSSVGGAASTASSNVQTTAQGTKIDGGASRGRGRNILSTQGSSFGSQIGHPPGDPRNYYNTSKKASKTWQTKEPHNGSSTSQSIISVSVMNAKSNPACDPKVISSYPVTENKDRFSSSEEEIDFDEQAPGYLTSLQTLTELQQVLNAPAVPSITAKTDKLTFPVTPTQPEKQIKTGSCGRGRGILLNTQERNSTGNPGFKFESAHPETEKMSSRPAQQSNFVSSQLLSTGTAVTGIGARTEIKNKTAGMDGTNSSIVHGVASTASSSIQRMSQETNMDKEAECVKEENSSYVYSGSQAVHPPDATEENYYTASKEDAVPCQTKDGESDQECEVSPSYHRGEKDGLSSESHEEMEQRNKQSKTTDELVQSIISKFWSSR